MLSRSGGCASPTAAGRWSMVWASTSRPARWSVSSAPTGPGRPPRWSASRACDGPTRDAAGARLRTRSPTLIGSGPLSAASCKTRHCPTGCGVRIPSGGRDLAIRNVQLLHRRSATTHCRGPPRGDVQHHHDLRLDRRPRRRPLSGRVGRHARLHQICGPRVGEHAIRVNAVAPGFVPTESATAQILSAPDAADRMRGLIPLGRFGRSEEIADAVSFLMSDQASYITSSILTVDAACRSEYQCTPPRQATTARDPVRNRVVAALPGGPHPIGSWAMIRMASARGNVRRGCGPRRRPCRQARWLAATAGTGRAGIPTGRGWCGRA